MVTLKNSRATEAEFGSVRRVLQKPVQARGHGMLVKFDVTDLTKVARHDREGSYEGND